MTDADIHIPVQSVEEARTLLGPLDSNARLIRELHGVSVLARDGSLRLLGDSGHVHVVQQVLEECLGMMRGGRRVSTQEVAGRLRATLGVDLVGPYEPLPSGFDYEKLGVVAKPPAAYR
jgi:phosphate starvation-inducible protein PhoH